MLQQTTSSKCIILQSPELEIQHGFQRVEVKMWASVLPPETPGESGPLPSLASAGAPAPWSVETSFIFKASTSREDPSTVISHGYSLPFNLPCGRTLITLISLDHPELTPHFKVT